MMTALTFLWCAACLLGFGVSVKSVAALRGRSAWTIAGWVATAAYFAVAGIAAARVRHAPGHADYVALGALTACFIIAGLRDEPQAEPWWWPTRSGPTGAERRARR